MEGGKKQDAGAPANSSSSSTSSSSPSGFFSSVFPPPSTVMAKDSSQSDLYWTLSKQRADGSIGNAQGAATDLIDICKLRWMWFRLTMVFEMANHREVQPKGKQHGARMVNQLIPVNLKNQPISAHLCTMGVVISMSLLHPTKSLELQKVTKLMKGMVRVTQTLPTEVNGGKVVGRATAIPVIGSHLVSSYRSPLKHQRKSGFDLFLGV
ncbi:uncharacterized protein LOC135624352 isoform X1 [Musa acuminata AAA Group]|uniref:uncharacterized protein LOC135624352 isoform X1 n=1 Tax=Musa acuminata AAA Group TaxID=214697 RepID=UPI0031D79184